MIDALVTIFGVSFITFMVVCAMAVISNFTYDDMSMDALRVLFILSFALSMGSFIALIILQALGKL